MRHFITALMLLLAAAGIQAQTLEKQETTRTIRGAVIDKNGNPLPGATVSATGGAETVVTDADGTFTIEVPIWLKSLTASYPGIGETKMKTSAYDQMIFTLKSRYRTYGFINLVGQYRTAIGSEVKIPAQGEFGIMGGAYRSWGGYVKCVLRCVGGTPETESGYRDPYDVLPTTTVGAIKRINDNFNVFFGGGVAFNYGVDYEYSDYLYRENEVTGAAELGGMWKFSRKLNATFGVTYIFPASYCGNSGNLGFFLGVGLNI